MDQVRSAMIIRTAQVYNGENCMRWNHIQRGATSDTVKFIQTRKYTRNVHASRAEYGNGILSKDHNKPPPPELPLKHYAVSWEIFIRRHALSVQGNELQHNKQAKKKKRKYSE